MIEKQNAMLERMIAWLERIRIELRLDRILQNDKKLLRK